MRTNEPEATNHKPAPPAPRRARRPAAAASPRTSARKALPSPPARAAADDEIRLRAYQFFLERDGAPGDPLADWLRAERELIAERAARRYDDRR
jgi:hypothetical protein